MRSTIRHIKNSVMNYDESEVRVREATSNDSWGASSSLMQEIADDTTHRMRYPNVLNMVTKRLTDYQHMNHVLKALILIEYLLRNGDVKFVHDMIDQKLIIKRLKGYKFFKDNKEVGENVRNWALKVSTLLEDKDELKRLRKIARAVRVKIKGYSHKENPARQEFEGGTDDLDLDSEPEEEKHVDHVSDDQVASASEDEEVVVKKKKTKKKKIKKKSKKASKKTQEARSEDEEEDEPQSSSDKKVDVFTQQFDNADFFSSGFDTTPAPSKPVADTFAFDEAPEDGDWGFTGNATQPDSSLRQRQDSGALFDFAAPRSAAQSNVSVDVERVDLANDLFTFTGLEESKPKKQLAKKESKTLKQMGATTPSQDPFFELGFSTGPPQPNSSQQNFGAPPNMQAPQAYGAPPSDYGMWSQPQQSSMMPLQNTNPFAQPPLQGQPGMNPFAQPLPQYGAPPNQQTQQPFWN